MYVNIPVPWSIWVLTYSFNWVFHLSLPPFSWPNALFADLCCDEKNLSSVLKWREGRDLPWNLTQWKSNVGGFCHHPNWKICASQIGSWNSSSGWKLTKIFELPPARYPLDLHPYITSNCQFTTSIFRLGSPELNLYLLLLLGGDGRSKISNIMLLCNFANDFLISMQEKTECNLCNYVDPVVCSQHADIENIPQILD